MNLIIVIIMIMVIMIIMVIMDAGEIYPKKKEFEWIGWG